MKKWRLNRPGVWDYPALGIRAREGDVIERDTAPDAHWEPVKEEKGGDSDE